MEWSKTKTYLIIALLITNLILIFSIYSDRKNFSDKFDSKNLKNLEKLLSDRNISSEVKLNTNTTKISSIELRYATLGDDELKKLLENYKDKIEVVDDLYIKFSLKTEKNMKYDEFLDFSKRFIKDNFEEKKYKIKNKYNSGDIMTIEYEELYEDMFLEHGYIKFAYNINDKVDISIVKASDIHKVGKPIDVISNAEAVSKLLPKIKSNIKAIDIGYYKIEDWQALSTSRIRLIPFWRIEIDDGSLIYTEAIRN